MQCICCGSSDNYLRGKKKGYSIYICRKCRFEFVAPLPTSLELEKFYQQGISEGIGDTIKTVILDLENNKNHPKRDWFVRIINKVEKITGKKKLKILEIGSSMGSFVHQANKMGHEATGTEISEDIANSTKGLIRGEVVYTGNERYDSIFPPDYYDLIYMEHVLEHLINPPDTIQQVSNLLNKDGILVISVPNQNSWMAKIYGIYWDWMSPPLHLHYFNKNNLQMVLTKFNLVIAEHWTGEYYFRSVYQFFSLAFFIYRFKQVSNKIFKSNFNTEYNFKYLYKYPKKLSEIIDILPYYIMFPFVKLFSYIGWGNDLTVIIKKAK